MHDARNLRCDDFCQNYGPLLLHLLYNIYRNLVDVTPPTVFEAVTFTDEQPRHDMLMCIKQGICPAMIFARLMVLCFYIYYTTYSEKLLLQFSKHFLLTFKGEQSRNVDVHEARILRCDDFCHNYGPLFLHLLYRT